MIYQNPNSPQKAENVILFRKKFLDVIKNLRVSSSWIEGRP
jgi:hypothetical protein